MNPSTNKKPIKNGTFCRLKTWMDKVGVPHWDFHNVVPEKTGDVKMEDVDWDQLYEKCQDRKAIITLGGFAKRAVECMIRNCAVIGADIISIDHPSPRNRNFNDPAYEPEMLKRLKEELKTCGIGS